MPPQVSLITTCYNRDRYLSATLASILTQTYSDFELLVWDDGSRDQSVAIAREFAEHDQRVRVVAAAHRGAAGALRAAIGQTEGTYLAWVDSDDLLAPTALAETVALLEANQQLGMVYTDYLVIDENTQVTGYGSRCSVPYSSERLLNQFMTFHLRLLRRNVYEQVGGIDPGYDTAEDYELCLRLSEVTEIYHLTQPLYYYRNHSASLSNQRRAEQEWQCERARQAAILRRRGISPVPEPSPLIKMGTAGVLLAGLPLLTGNQANAVTMPTSVPVASVSDSPLAPFQLSTQPLPTGIAQPESFPRNGKLLLAQAITPAADGTNTQVLQNNNQFNITGGQLSKDGANLFHSFQKFGLDTNQIANFLANPQTRNILGQVIGGDPSYIDGLLRVSGGNANLFLTNPAGLVFGANVRLDVPGSFTATTANGIGFGDKWLSAIGTNNYAELTGNPTSLAFSLQQPGAIFNAGNLTVQPGQNLSLLGGTVVNTGNLSATTGDLLIAAVPGTSTVRISQPGSPLTIELQVPSMPTPSAAIPLATLAANQPGLTFENDRVRTAGTDLPVQVGDVAIARPAAMVNGQTIRLIASENLTLAETQIRALEDISIQANKTVRVRDSISTPMQVQAGNNLTIQGNQSIDILALNHPITPFQSGGNLSLMSDGVISGDAHFFSGGNFSIQNLSGGTGQFISLYDPIVRSTGDVTFGSYTGVALKVEAGGNITFNGDIRITAPDSTIPTSDPDATALTTTPALILRAGVAVAAPEVPAIPGLVITQPPSAAGDITVSGDIDTSNFVITTGGEFPSPVESLGGPVTLDARGSILTGNINASANGSEIFVPKTGGNVNLIARNGNIQTGDIDTSAIGARTTATAGNVSLQALNGTLTVGEIDTSATASNFGSGVLAQAGSVDARSRSGITAQNIFAEADAEGSIYGSEARGGVVALSVQNGALQVDRISTITTANASDDSVTARSGNVTLETQTPGNNIQFTSIDAVAFADNSSEGATGPATATSGNVQVLAQGTVQGTGVGQSEEFTIDNRTFANGTEITEQIGTVTLQHDGGPNNLPFVLGDAAVNGLSNGVVTGSINTPVIFTTGSFPVLPNGGDAAGTPTGVTIRSLNTPPTLTAISTLPTAPPEQPIVLTFADLATTVTDTNLDVTTVTIAAIAPGAVLRVNGTTATTGTVIAPGDTLEYLTPPGATGTFTAFSLQASDGVSTSAPVAIAQTIPSIIIEPPEVELPAPPEAEPKPPLVIGNPRFALKTFEEAQQVLQEIEKETGVRPALIYIRFIPSRFGAGLNFASQEAAFTEAYTRYLAEQNPAGVGLKVEGNEDDGVEILMVTAKGNPFRLRLKGLTRQDLIATAKVFKQEVSDRRKTRTTSYQASAQQLYQWLIAPLESELQAREINNLVFVMDEQLRSLPVAALQNAQGEFLIQKYSLGLMPSLSLTDTRYVDIRKTQVLAMGTDKFDRLRQLPAVPLELQAIKQSWNATVYPDQEFTLNNLKTARDSQPFGIVHLATHGEFRPKDSSNSYVQLGDVQLRLDQLRELGLNNPPAQLLVLSACRTALGDRDAELGFAGMAVKAGSKSALGSLWYVSDIGTLALMSKFYESLRQTPIKAEAVRQAQLALLDGTMTVTSDQQLTGLMTGNIALPPELLEQEIVDFSHPFYWSPFTMIGNPW